MRHGVGTSGKRRYNRIAFTDEPVKAISLFDLIEKLLKGLQESTYQNK
jgi:hypothetical protein